MDFRSTITALFSSDTDQRSAAQDMLRNLTPSQVEQFLEFARAQERFRNRWKMLVHVCFGLYFALTVCLGDLSAWPIAGKISYTILGLALIGLILLLNFGALSQGYRRTVEALTYVETDSTDVLGHLIDSFDYDWTRTRLAMTQAIGRLLPKFSHTEIIYLYTEKRKRHLWWAVRNYGLPPRQITTTAQAENIVIIMKSLIACDRKMAVPNLNMFVQIPKDHAHSEGQQYLQAEAKNEWQRLSH